MLTIARLLSRIGLVLVRPGVTIIRIANRCYARAWREERTLREKLIAGDVPGLGSYRDPRPGDIRSPEITRTTLELRERDAELALRAMRNRDAQ